MKNKWATRALRKEKVGGFWLRGGGEEDLKCALNENLVSTNLNALVLGGEGRPQIL